MYEEQIEMMKGVLTNFTRLRETVNSFGKEFNSFDLKLTGLNYVLTSSLNNLTNSLVGKTPFLFGKRQAKRATEYAANTSTKITENTDKINVFNQSILRGIQAAEYYRAALDDEESTPVRRKNRKENLEEELAATFKKLVELKQIFDKLL